MACAPDFSHAALSELFFKVIAPELPRTSDFAAESIQHTSAEVGHAHDDEIGEHEANKELRWFDAQGGRPGRQVQSNDDGVELTDTSAATSARRGAVGTTIVNRTTQTATQDNPR